MEGALLMWKRLLVVVLLAAALLPLAPQTEASAANRLWGYRNGVICVETHGWKFWPAAEAARRWNAAPDVVVFTRDDCRAAGYPRSQTITLSVYYDYRRNECGYTSAGRWLDAGGIVRTMTIRLNLSAHRRAGCFATYSHRAHVISHELGHALGLPHGGSGVLDSWAYAWPTAADIRDLERVHPW